MGDFTHIMNVTTNGQGRSYMDECSDTSILLLSNKNSTKVSSTLRNFTMVGVKKYPIEMYMLIWSGSDAVDIPNSTIII